MHVPAIAHCELFHHTIRKSKQCHLADWLRDNVRRRRSNHPFILYKLYQGPTIERFRDENMTSTDLAIHVYCNRRRKALQNSIFTQAFPSRYIFKIHGNKCHGKCPDLVSDGWVSYLRAYDFLTNVLVKLRKV